MGCRPFEDYLLIEAVLLAMLICFHEIVPPAAQNDNTEEISDTRGSYLASPFQSAWQTYWITTWPADWWWRLHGQQSRDVEEHSYMLAGLWWPSDGRNCPLCTWTSGSGCYSQCWIEPEGENVYILLTFLLRRLNIWRRRLLFATNSNRDSLWDFNSRLNNFPQWGTVLRMEYFCRRQILETMTDACLLKHG